MPTIRLFPKNSPTAVTQITCGSSTPAAKLGGSIDVSQFTNLTSFKCIGNDISSLVGYENLQSLNTLDASNNLITGSIPALSSLTNLQYFNCDTNNLTGSIPSLIGLTNLLFFYCPTNNLTGSIPALTSLTNLRQFICAVNNLTGSIPPLTGLTNLQILNFSDNGLTGPIPSLIGLTKLQSFYGHTNNLTGSIPDLSSLTNLEIFNVATNNLAGSIPTLTSLTNLRQFTCSSNNLTGSIPTLMGLTKLQTFNCATNNLTGSIPDLSSLTNLQIFNGDTNDLTDFAGGSVSNTLGDFKVQNNQLSSTAIDSLLSAFVVANKTTGTRILNLGGIGNAAPSSVGVSKLSLIGNAFSRIGTTVTVNSGVHGYITGDWVTITDIAQVAFRGTFIITRINDNVFQYTTISSGELIGSGIATLRKTSNGNTSGFRSYQNLALVSRMGGPWSITINFPA